MDKDQESVLQLVSGEILQFDFRSAELKAAAQGNDLDVIGTPLKVMTWNVERGAKLQEIIAALKEYNGDIITLQDLDSNCKFTEYKDTGLEIARALGMNYIYQQEFVEIGQGQGEHIDGAHGNAILTKFDVSAHVNVPHSLAPYNWDEDGEKQQSQPRKGNRVSMCVTVDVPATYSVQYCSYLKKEDLSVDAEEAVLPRKFHVDVYTFHFELFCGITHRMKYLNDLFSFIRARAQPYVLFMGDTNMLAHGQCRFVGQMCVDSLRHKTYGYNEAAYTTLNALDVYVEDAIEAIAQKDTDQAAKILKGELEVTLYNPKILQLQQWSSDFKGLETLLNPALSEVFDYNTETVAALGGLFSAKADALMTRGFSVVAHHIGNQLQDMSNHRSLHCSVFLDERKVNKVQQHDEINTALVTTKEDKLTINNKTFTVYPCAIQGSSAGISTGRWMPYIRTLIIAVIVFVLLNLGRKK